MGEGRSGRVAGRRVFTAMGRVTTRRLSVSRTGVILSTGVGRSLRTSDLSIFRVVGRLRSGFSVRLSIRSNTRAVGSIIRLMTGRLTTGRSWSTTESSI